MADIGVSRPKLICDKCGKQVNELWRVRMTDPHTGERKSDWVCKECRHESRG